MAIVLWGIAGLPSAHAQTATENVDTVQAQPGSSSQAGGSSKAAKPAQPAGAADLGLALPQLDRKSGDTASAVRIVLALTLLAILPSLLVCLTSFLRIVIVLSMLRHAIGMPETPPNTVVIGLALFLTLFTMNPVLQQVNNEALQPFMAGKLGIQQGVDTAARPLREFMVRQTREQDLALMVEISKSKRPTSIDDIGNLQLIPAFMLSELRAAFQIGFVVFLPFLLIDLIVSSILMSLGMMMMPPITIALPIKILMFVLVDGWALIVKALVGSFH
ncbi:flagellar type III secretion system pore protein FliP [Ideonella sp. YS5]|uniref:flagellar type III secretion system pore protein FliP n=1 Tax=Ideonella sp. YS5 TaxID=3453714 RepID=UPI003EEEB1BF